MVEGPLLPLLRAAQAAVVTSGTATIEAALARTPHVIVYRTRTPTYWLARTLITVPHIGMANIVLGRRAVPELVQGGLEHRALQAALEPLLAAGSAARSAQEAAFDELRAALGGGGAADRIAVMAAEMLESSAPTRAVAG
jgi:lipid-A-disaccharide synthase